MKTSLKLWDDAIAAEPEAKALALSKLAEALWGEGDQAEAIAVQLELRDFLNVSGNIADWLDVSWQVGLKYHIIGDSVRAIEMVEETLPEARAFGSNHNYGFLNLLKGYALTEVEDFTGAVVCMTKAADAFSLDENTEMVADALLSRAGIHVTLSDSEAATRDYADARQLFESAGKADRVLETILEYGEFQFDLSKYGLSRNLIHDALHLARFLRDLDSEQKAFRLLGECHSLMNDSATAISLFKRAIAIRDSVEQQKESARAMLALSQHNYRNGEEALGAKQRMEVVPILEALGLPGLTAEK